MNTENIRFASNRVRDVERLYREELEGLYGIGEVRVFVEMLFEAFCGWDKVGLLLNRDATINQSDLLRFHWALEDLKKERPIQQIIGSTEFCGCRIGVDESTLIPRPETEEIVEKTIALFGKHQPLHVLDLCTGSGAIAIALAKAWPEAAVTAVDISEKAMAKARQNAQENGVRVTFMLGDLLEEELQYPSPVDLIVSNPPYVCDSERYSMHHNVLEYEPSTALFVPDSNPLLFYKRIADIGMELLSEEGMMVLEINEKFGLEMVEMLGEKGFECSVEKDFRGKERMIVARRRK